jgi:hypothetical protein
MNSTMAAMSRCAVPAVAAGTRSEQHQQRAQPFAATADDVVADLVDKHHVRLQALEDDLVDSLNVFAIADRSVPDAMCGQPLPPRPRKSIGRMVSGTG